MRGDKGHTVSWLVMVGFQTSKLLYMIHLFIS